MTGRDANPLAWIAIVLVLGVAFVVAVGALSMTTSGGYYGMMGSGGWPWAMAFMAVPGIILILALLFAVGVLNPNRSYIPYPQPMSAMEILDQRYARGELSREDYLRMRSEVIAK